jgi:hypothetical protein
VPGPQFAQVVAAEQFPLMLGPSNRSRPGPLRASPTRASPSAWRLQYRDNVVSSGRFFDKILAVFGGSPYGYLLRRRLPYESVTLNRDGTVHQCPSYSGSTAGSVTSDGWILAFSRYRALDDAIKHSVRMHVEGFWQASGYQVVGRDNLMLAVQRLSAKPYEYVWGITLEGVAGKPVFSESGSLRGVTCEICDEIVLLDSDLLHPHRTNATPGKVRGFYDSQGDAAYHEAAHVVMRLVYAGEQGFDTTFDYVSVESADASDGRVVGVPWPPPGLPLSPVDVYPPALRPRLETEILELLAGHVMVDRLHQEGRGKPGSQSRFTEFSSGEGRISRLRGATDIRKAWQLAATTGESEEAVARYLDWLGARAADYLARPLIRRFVVAIAAALLLKRRVSR